MKRPLYFAGNEAEKCYQFVDESRCRLHDYAVNSYV